ncbi:MAG: MGH1-like glycoside hydrolase domain-containing protein, partial [Candidatus Limnocylindria bacterium]
YYGPELRHAIPAPDGEARDLRSIADELARRLISLYLPDADGVPPALGADSRWRASPLLRERLLFYEYFHGETGWGLGASHQTGWTALIANLVDELHRPGRS